jgi:hypothetical protein
MWPLSFLAKADAKFSKNNVIDLMAAMSWGKLQNHRQPPKPIYFS